MIRRTSFQVAAIGAALTFASACTMKSQEAPPLSGPSEFAKSVGISLSPEVLTQDGASQSLIDVTVRDSNGSPVGSQSLRAEIQVGGVSADFGSLSARNLMTGSNGHATAVYTAPAAPAVAVDGGIIVDIVITPVGCPPSQQCVNDFNNSTPRTASIRLVPPGSVAPPDGLKPNFTFTPSSPVDSQTVLFDASGSTSSAGNPIVSYSWNFGDGGRGSGVTAGHSYTTAGSFVATLTISDAFGRSAQKSANIVVTAGVNPTAAFTSSPSDPLVNQAVNFNASGTRAAPGHMIKSYDWDFGDGVFGAGITTTHTYGLARSYVVVLTVTDDSGKKGTATGTVAVK